MIRSRTPSWNLDAGWTQRADHGHTMPRPGTAGWDTLLLLAEAGAIAPADTGLSIEEIFTGLVLRDRDTTSVMNSLSTVPSRLFRHGAVHRKRVTGNRYLYRAAESVPACLLAMAKTEREAGDAR